MSKLTLSAGTIDERATIALRGAKLKARYDPRSLNGAVLSAGYYAKKVGQIVFVYEGSSFMHRTFNGTLKESEARNPISNTGNRVLTVTPDLIVSWHLVLERQ